MNNVKTIISSYSDEINEHRVWLEPFGKQRLDKWEELLAVNPEAAICEALTRLFLSKQGVFVKPYEDLSRGGPDLICYISNISFYMEITCVTKEKVTKKSKLNDQPTGASYYKLLTDVFLGELRNKVPQCSKLDAPCIVAICTLHRQGGAKCFGKIDVEDLLTGTTHVSMEFDTKQGQGVGKVYKSTDLRDSAFIRLDKTSTGQIEFARNSISAVLLCAFGYLQMKVVGALHPNPNYPFNRTLLDKIEFGRLAEGCIQTDRLNVEWI